MRLRSLTLERFGAFTDFGLAFDGAADIWLVVGPNEAGKSSALAGLIDLLFGIEPRTPYAFRHSYDRLRLAGEISNKAGAALAFRRRKGSRNTLLDASDRPMPDGSLTTFLGQADRDLFTRAFGLSHDRLRQGGDQLLQARGDIGEILLQAGGGLTGLVDLHRRFQDRADTLFNPDRRVATKPIDAALRRADEARKAIRANALKADDWHGAHDALAQAELARDDLRARHRDLAAESAKVNRGLRVQPLLARLDQMQAEHATLTAVPNLPEDFDKSRLRVLQVQARAEEDLGRIGVTIARLEADLDQVQVPERLLARAEDVEALYERRGAILQAREDLPNRREESGREQDALSRLAVRLGLAAETDLPARRPSDVFLADIQRLRREGIEAQQNLKEAKRSDRLALAALEEADRRLGGLSEPEKSPPLRRQLEQLRPVIGQAGRLHLLRAEVTTHEIRLVELLAALPLWSGDSDALAAAEVPVRETLRRFQAEGSALAQRHSRALEEIDAADAEKGAAQAELTRLAAAGAVPTPEAVRDARLLRDRCWRLLRRAHIDGGSPLTLEERAAFGGDEVLPDPALPEAYEGLVAAADSLVDRREVEARRIEAHASAVARAEAASARRAEASMRLHAMDAQLAQHQQDWQEVWAPAGIVPLPPPEMEPWLDARLAVLKSRETLMRARDGAAALTASLGEAEAELNGIAATLGVTLDPAEDLGSRFAAVDAAVESLDSVTEAWRAARQHAEQCREASKQAMARRLEVQAELDAWQGPWGESMVRLGLGPAAGIEEAEAALSIWAEVAVHQGKLTDLAHRIRRIDENERAFGGAVKGLIGDVAPDLASVDPVEAAARLFKDLHTARKADAEHIRLSEALVAARVEQADTQKRRKTAKSDMAALLRLARVETPAELDGLAEQSARRRRLAAEIDAAREALMQAGGGPDEAALRAEVAGVDPDAQQGRAAALQAELADLAEALDQAGQRLAQCRAEAERLDQLAGAGAAAQDLQDALTDVRRLAADWARTRVAAVLLKAAVDRYREENQHPLVQRASQIFTPADHRILCPFGR